MVVRDAKTDSGTLTFERTEMDRNTKIAINLRAGGGFVARFNR